jgi:glycosyltransferase involved in cell wall biosynthesis
VIVRNLGALTEVVAESGGGFIFNNDEELLSAINQIGSGQSLRDELGEKGYRTFIQRWSKEAHLAQYFKFLEKIAKEKFGEIPWE